MGDWKGSYRTMDSEFVKRQISVFYWMLSHSYVYQRYMPVYWSPSSKTALAESELEYNAQHKSTSVYVRFPINNEFDLPLETPSGADVYLLIWTTTPWSLAANRAVCYNPDLEYCFVRHPSSGDLYIVAIDSLYTNEALKKIFGLAPEVKHLKLLGLDLASLTYRNPVFANQPCDESMHIYPASHVTMTSGTGLVHTAPAHGPEDYLIGVDNHLDLSCPVDENGCYDSTVPANLRGLFALEEGNTEIISMLENDRHILLQGPYIHSYPYDWRTKKPVLLRASKQWFIDTGKLQPKAMNALKNVDIYPNSAANGFQGVLDKRPYWCISRQRVWGVPIPVFYDSKGDVVISKEIVDRYMDLIDTHGSDFWWKLEATDILRGLNVENSEQMTKSCDILDVWFDSGISWHNVIEPDSNSSLKQSDVYIEGLDQFSGWFYSSLLTSVALQSAPPFKKLYVHGFTMDENGRKMSKSLGNVVSPTEITQGWSLKAGSREDQHIPNIPLHSVTPSKKAAKQPLTVFGVDVLRYDI